MRACATANAIFVGLALAGLSFAACSSGQTPTPSPSGAPGESSTSTVVTVPTETAPASAASGSAAEGPPKSEITNEPKGGVVMNNASTAGDAGATDRTQPLIDLYKANRDKFRACFDVFSKTHKGQNGNVTLVVKLKPDGTFIEAEAHKTKSTLQDASLEACMVGEAKKLTHPKSPSGKETTFTYPFDFKAH